MSNSSEHQEGRRLRAEQRQYENRMHRNASRKAGVVSVVDLEVHKVVWWRRFLFWLKRVFT